MPSFRLAAIVAGLLAVFVSADALAASSPAPHQPTITHALKHDVSAPLRDIIRMLPPQAPRGSEQEPYLVPNILLKPRSGSTPKHTVKSPGFVMQTTPSGTPAPDVLLSFDAMDWTACGGGCLPPDTEGDVGDQYYIQWVNTSFTIYDKTDGSIVQAQTPGNAFWTGFGGKCETTNSGDPLITWDARAHRWIASQFVTSSPYGQCVAVSTTSDPLGTWYRYEFQWPYFGDYGKLAVWTDTGQSQDAYLLTTHEFNGNSFVGAAMIAMQRDAMLTGADAAVVRFPGYDAYGIEPINLTGPLDAPAGSCPAYVHFTADGTAYEFWNLCLDWTNPANSVISTEPDLVTATAPFTPYFNEVPQPGTPNGLDPFGTHIMFRANARAFPAGAPTTMSLVVNHVVLGNVQQGAIDWVHFDLEPAASGGGDRIFGDGFDGTPLPPLTTPAPMTKTLVDEGVFAPDSDNRWMGGIAIDQNADIGVGYSVSSDVTNPQIRITGRTLGDPAATLRGEQSCTDGIANGSQTSSSNRWGDYSAMSVDPSDQCTFWYTNEYYPTTASSHWQTHVCTFRFDNCGQPDFALVADSPKRVEVCGATATGDPAYQLRAGVLSGFTGQVTLAANNVPSGATAGFSTNPIDAPGTSVLTLTGGAALPTGEYAFNVDGTSGSLTRSISLQLGVSATATGAPALTSPADGATGVSVRALLSWAADPGALSYFVEVASDAAFTNVVASGTTSDTSWSVSIVLDQNTTYYWRVTPNNYCGAGAVSATYSFTTGVPGTCPSGTTATTLFSDDFQSGANGWTTDGSGATGWSQQNAPGGTGLSTTVWGVPDNGTDSDRGLLSPSITVPAGAVSVFAAYDTYHSFETFPPDQCYDNGTLEIAVDGATDYTYLDDSHMLTDPYDGLVTSGEVNAGEYGWCYAPATPPIHAVVDLSGYAGHAVQLHFRAVSDPNATAPAPNGMYLDDFSVTACQ